MSTATPAIAVIDLTAPVDAATAAAEALDHLSLFALGLEQLRALSGRVWTDHNIHDPGITTLELLAYALTDLAYRASFPIADLLAAQTGNAEAMQAQFFTARQILPSAPLTTADYRRLLIDVVGIKNAWIRPATETLYADTLRGRLQRERPADMTGFVQVDLRGLYAVTVEYMDGLPALERAAALAAVRARLHANRNLCEDFVSFDQVQEQPFIICGEVELEPGADLPRVHAEILFAVQQYLSPPVLQYSLAEMQARTHADGTPYGVEDIYDGPPLEHGFIDAAELAAAELRTEIRLSDVMSVVMDIPGVRAVRDLLIHPAPPSRPPESKWRVPVIDGRKPTLNPDGCRLVFYKRHMPFTVERAAWGPYWDALAAEATARVETPREEDLPVPLGRWRSPAAYHSFQNHFPALYGLGEAGLPGGADEQRARLAYQLKGYLLFFDQLMADFMAQLASIPLLFSTDWRVTRTDHHQPVTSFPEWRRIYRGADVQAALEAGLDDEAAMTDRRNHFLDHLIARHGERFHELAEVMRTEFGLGQAAMVRYKCDFLTGYPETGRRRGMAYDYSLDADADLWNSANVSGLELRLASLLGIPNATRRNLGDVSYDLYAEVDGTPDDEFRFRVRHPVTQKILLSSSTRYPTHAAARAEMRRAIRFAQTPAGYQRRQTVAEGVRFFFNIIDDTGEVLARRIEYFRTPEEMEAAIEQLMDHLRTTYSEEGMYLIENILLRPEEEDDPFLPICPDPNCADCADEDPYSYRIHIILPAFGGRFEDMEFRRWAEQVIREETPAHIQPKVCWINADDMAELEGLYRDWIYLRAGRETANRTATLQRFITTLFRVKNVYPPQRLRDCRAPEKFVLGHTALGSMDA
ncbi:MAG TPA: hypothetical protein VEQ60_19510 [Longimicrobium sp.]|nr:hypothetical protein [Longimicrobium sp.]